MSARRELVGADEDDDHLRKTGLYENRVTLSVGLAPQRVLITGGRGQLASELLATAPSQWEVFALGRSELDITSAENVMAVASRFRPSLVINTAAYTAVDQAESESSAAFAVNEAGPANLVAAAEAKAFRLIHISTDFVFGGNQRGPRPYRPDDVPAPLSVYGASKLGGERRLIEAGLPGTLILRTAWLYAARGKNFVLTILGALRSRDRLRVVADQIGSPTWARSLAEILWKFAGDRKATGVFHWVDSGETTWYDFAVAIQDEALELGLTDKPIPIERIATGDYPQSAMRPAYSALDCSKTVGRLGQQQQPWQSNLRLMLRQVNELKSAGHAVRPGSLDSRM